MFRLPVTTFPALRTIAVLVGPVCASLASSALAQGAPRSIGECERLKNDLAYNQCLAMFGPEARMITGGDGAPGRGPSAPQASAAAMAAIPYAADAPQTTEEPSATEKRGRYSRRGGRQSASFEVGGSSSRRSWSRWRRHRR